MFLDLLLIEWCFIYNLSNGQKPSQGISFVAPICGLYTFAICGMYTGRGLQEGFLQTLQLMANVLDNNGKPQSIQESQLAHFTALNISMEMQLHTGMECTWFSFTQVQVCSYNLSNEYKPRQGILFVAQINSL